MAVNVAEALIAVFGVLLVLVSAVGILAPGMLLRTVDRVMDRRAGMVVAVAVRVVLGVALLLAASASRWPRVFQVLGWLTLAAAVVIPLLGRDRVSSVVDWMRGVHPILVQVWLVFGVLFGGMLAVGAAGGS